MLDPTPRIMGPWVIGLPWSTHLWWMGWDNTLGKSLGFWIVDSVSTHGHFGQLKVFLDYRVINKGMSMSIKINTSTHGYLLGISYGVFHLMDITTDDGRHDVSILYSAMIGISMFSLEINTGETYEVNVNKYVIGHVGLIST